MGKKSRNLLPKKIAGVKVPKAVRKGHFGELLASPAGQKLLAQAIVAAGAVASASAGAKTIKDSPKARDKLGKAADRLKDAGDSAGKSASEASGVIAYALGEAARSFADALQRHGRDDETPSASEHWSDDAADSKKKPISYEAGPL